jgi:hypothetical protein
MPLVAETPWFKNDDERDPQIARLARIVVISMQVAWCMRAVGDGRIGAMHA